MKQTGGWLREALWLDDEVLEGAAYTEKLVKGPVQLVFDQSSGVAQADDRLELLQNRPNPFNETTIIGFVLPEACDATLRVFDVNGRLIRERTANYAAGGHFATFDFGSDSQSGVLQYELTTPWGVLTKKMVLVRD